MHDWPVKKCLNSYKKAATNTHYDFKAVPFYLLVKGLMFHETRYDKVNTSNISSNVLGNRN